MAIGTVFKVWVSVLVVVAVVESVAVVVVVAMEVVTVLVVVVVSDSFQSLFPEVLRISRYDNAVTRPGIDELSRLPERCPLEEYDLFRDLAMS